MKKRILIGIGGLLAVGFALVQVFATGPAKEAKAAALTAHIAVTPCESLGIGTVEEGKAPGTTLVQNTSKPDKTKPLPIIRLVLTAGTYHVGGLAGVSIHGPGTDGMRNKLVLREKGVRVGGATWLTTAHWRGDDLLTGKDRCFTVVHGRSVRMEYQGRSEDRTWAGGMYVVKLVDGA
jgi:hypothetical protein